MKQLRRAISRGSRVAAPAAPSCSVYEFCLFAPTELADAVCSVALYPATATDHATSTSVQAPRGRETPGRARGPSPKGPALGLLYINAVVRAPAPAVQSHLGQSPQVWARPCRVARPRPICHTAMAGRARPSPTARATSPSRAPARAPSKRCSSSRAAAASRTTTAAGLQGLWR